MKFFNEISKCKVGRLAAVFFTAIFLCTGPGLPILTAQDTPAGFPAELKHERFNAGNRLLQSEYEPDNRYDVSYYGINLEILPLTEEIAGFVHMRVVAAEPLTDLRIDLNPSMQIDSVLIGGDYIAEFDRHATDDPWVVVIQTTQQFLPGDVIDLNIYYHGSPDQTGFGSFTFSTAGGSPAIWSLSQPYGARDWFPVKDHPSDKADSADIIITVPSPLKVGSNGSLISVTELDGNRTRWHWSTRYPIAHYLISVAIADYQEFTQWFSYAPGDSMPVLNYIYPAANISQVMQQAAVTIDLLEVFSDLFGLYPFIDEKYGHAQFGWGGGMEHQTMSSMFNFSRRLIAHELAHQWFGNTITCDSWHHIWFNEGFATFLEGITFEALDGEAAYMNWRRDVINLVTSEDDGSLYVPDEFVDPGNISESISRIFNYRLSYAKGGMVLHMLRYELGDDDFFGALRAFLAGPYRFGTVTTDQFREALELYLGKDLSSFFEQWVYGEGHPEWTIRYAVQPSGNNYRTWMRLSQEPTNPSVSFFDQTLQIRLAGDSADTVITVKPEMNHHELEILLPFRPGIPEIDPESNLITGNKDYIQVGFGNRESQLPAVSRLLTNYPNPFNPETIIPYEIAAAGQVAIEVFDILGRKIATLKDESVTAGFHEVRWDGAGIPSGIYLVQLRTGGVTDILKITLLK
jgi:aminopeptidase N